MTDDKKKQLLMIARESIREAFNGRKVSIQDDDTENNGAFVTLKINNDLRGCIGFMEGIEPLNQMIADLAREAAFSDPRFPPLSPVELDECTISISLLTKPEKIRTLDEFVPGRDGIYMTVGTRRSVFLPQVAEETGWTKEEMLSALSRKAGLPSDSWKREDAEFRTFRAEVFDESIL